MLARTILVITAVAGASRTEVADVPVPRHVLVLYDGDEEPYLPHTVAHRRLPLPLEHLGFVPEYRDVREPLPRETLRGRYAGVVTWFSDDEMAAPERYRTFLLRALDEGVRLAVFGHMGLPLDRGLARRLGLELGADGDLEAFTVVRHDPALVGFEAPPGSGRGVPAIFGRALTRHLEVKDTRGRVASPVVTGPWGGLALDPFTVEEGFGRRIRWVLEPFAFLNAALGPSVVPVLDVTTENGMRLLTAHIDGDGFASRAEMPNTPFAGTVIRREILETFAVPTTVSIIEGEIGPLGMYPELAPELEDIARGIFRLPNVEIASHSFSHPFDWRRAAGIRVEQDLDDPDDDPPHLPIPGYRFDVKRDVEGSVRYIDARLAPPGKRTRVFLWSGAALPTDDAVRLASALGLVHVNGDNAEAPGDGPLLASVPSLGRPVAAGFQVYAPALNEMLYTDLWQGPYYGFRRVIEGFRLTDAPRRLKPISIYYHFYSGTKPAALETLREVYRWSLAQEIRPVWLSDYVRKVHEFQSATVALRPDGSWRIDGLDRLRTARIPRTLGWPDLNRSRGVVGLRDLPQGRFVAFDGSSRIVLAMTASPPVGPYLLWSNAEVLSWRRDGDGRDGSAVRVSFRLRSLSGPVRVAFGGCATGERLTGGAQAWRAVGSGDDLGGWRFSGVDTGEVTVACRQ